MLVSGAEQNDSVIQTHLPCFKFFSNYFCYYKVKVKVAQSCLTLCDPTDCTVHENSPGKNTRVGCLSLLQGIFATQGLNPGLLHCRWILYQLSQQGSPSTEARSLLQGIVPTLESNRGLLHCRWILYQLSYQRSPSLLQGNSRIFCAVIVGPYWFFILNIVVCTCYTFKKWKYRAKISV